jgi:integral membrane protein
VNLTSAMRYHPVARKVFRAVAIAEAVSWACLLVGMYFKWVAETTEVGVQVFGPVHGTLFIVYVLVALATASVFSWRPRTTLLALVAAVPPFATYPFERWALRRGLLGADEEPQPPTIPDDVAAGR